MSEMTFHESYGELPKSLLSRIRKTNVSPADYSMLEMQHGEGNYRAIHEAIDAQTRGGMFQPIFGW
jgi:hypothetical protein